MINILPRVSHNADFDWLPYVNLSAGRIREYECLSFIFMISKHRFASLRFASLRFTSLDFLSFPGGFSGEDDFALLVPF